MIEREKQLIEMGFLKIEKSVKSEIFFLNKTDTFLYMGSGIKVFSNTILSSSDDEWDFLINDIKKVQEPLKKLTKSAVMKNCVLSKTLVNIENEFDESFTLAILPHLGKLKNNNFWEAIKVLNGISKYDVETIKKLLPKKLASIYREMFHPQVAIFREHKKDFDKVPGLLNGYCKNLQYCFFIAQFYNTFVDKKRELFYSVSDVFDIDSEDADTIASQTIMCGISTFNEFKRTKLVPTNVDRSSRRDFWMLLEIICSSEFLKIMHHIPFEILDSLTEHKIVKDDEIDTLDSLKNHLSIAVLNEEYELAALLRDKINSLKNK